MNKHALRIAEVFHFLDNKDITLGYRKFLDCIIDTQHMDLYNEAIAITDWKEQHPQEVEPLIEKCKALLSKAENIPVEETTVTSPILTATNLVKSYGTHKFTLGPVSVTIKKGQVYGLVGENGNGKTTLLRILAKEITHNQGSLQFEFKDKKLSNFDLRTKLIYIPQRTDVWYGSLKDNLKFVLANYGVSPAENETRVLMMIARLGLWNYKHLKWSELSSGYKMRFELARTLLRQPEILLLDEPLANLDVLAQQVILEDLKAICNSVNNPIALILSSQQLYEVEKVSDKVIFLKNGKYKDNTEEEIDTQKLLIVEIDTTTNRTQLLELFKELALKKLTFNGGVFTAEFEPDVPFNKVLKALGESQEQVTYVRNISNSTRRFFVS
ncbi:ABC transporter ATP-binding protein [Neptunitalea lumnitzerae]|uniref:ABC transporter domain-containing protein n=1 Tax=Neptunitalea lumnitzerae TaxID=2965509 RepID=A0ABQ5MLW2_9FLAO|nr:ABC transporter ATP-binding protein [Neptunitalea sp. Y10]GLB50387.1 hypothetical protein Y10_27550 [Neptunitalea sp. Y10]